MVQVEVYFVDIVVDGVIFNVYFLGKWLFEKFQEGCIDVKVFIDFIVGF